LNDAMLRGGAREVELAVRVTELAERSGGLRVSEVRD
jgi:hypothetical protein